MFLFFLMERYPAAKDAFKYVDVSNPMGTKFSVHAVRVYTAFDMLVNMFHNPAAQDAAIEHLAEQHKTRPGIKKEYFMFWAQQIVAVAPHLLDDADTMSWEACMIPMMSKLASQLPD